MDEMSIKPNVSSKKLNPGQYIMEFDGTACPNANNCLGMYTWI